MLTMLTSATCCFVCCLPVFICCLQADMGFMRRDAEQQAARGAELETQLEATRDMAAQLVTRLPLTTCHYRHRLSSLVLV